MYFKYAKIRDVKTPARANPGDAGVDFYVPADFEEIQLMHGQSVKIPSGIKIEVPIGYAMIMHNKSGVAANKNLDVMACVIDHGYSGEVHINIINNGAAPQTIRPGDKIVQGIVLPIITPILEEVPEDALYSEVHVASARGDGGFGSTGTQ